MHRTNSRSVKIGYNEERTVELESTSPARTSSRDQRRGGKEQQFYDELKEHFDKVDSDRRLLATAQKLVGEVSRLKEQLAGKDDELAKLRQENQYLKFSLVDVQRKVHQVQEIFNDTDTSEAINSRPTASRKRSDQNSRSRSAAPTDSPRPCQIGSRQPGHSSSGRGAATAAPIVPYIEIGLDDQRDSKTGRKGRVRDQATDTTLTVTNSRVFTATTTTSETGGFVASLSGRVDYQR